MPPARRSRQFAAGQSSASGCWARATAWGAVLREGAGGEPPLLVDDLATWLTGVLDDTGGWEGSVKQARKACTELVDAVGACRAELVLVSAEVGLGVVPVSRSGR